VNSLVKQAEVFYDCALLVQQVIPVSVHGKRNVDELVEVRIVDRDDESLDLAVRRRPVAMKDDNVLFGKTAVTVGVIERKRKEIA